jgi:hypothetical protein
MMTTLAAIAFDPNIRGALVVLIGVIVLVGSTYLLVATNTGVRNGFLISMCALFGWMFSMGLIWWQYGIGLKGRDPSWMEQEINFTRDDAVINETLAKLPSTDELPDPEELFADFEEANPAASREIRQAEGESFRATTLTKAVTVAPELKVELDEQLNGWRILPESDSRRGDAAAAADAAIINEQVFGSETSSASYILKDVYFFGGKSGAEPETIAGEDNVFEQAWNRISTVFEPKNPPLYAAITVQKVEPQEVLPGEAPPPPVADESADTVTVLLLRNLGNKRLIPFLFTLFNGIIFAVLAWVLHNRDKRAMAVRQEWDPKAAVPAKVG